MEPHKWQKEIIAWANGETIQAKDCFGVWETVTNPYWSSDQEYRVKPKEDKWQKVKDHWKNGGKIQFLNVDNKWIDYPYSIRDFFSSRKDVQNQPHWWGHEWRIKPEPKIEYTFNDQVRDEIDSILDCFDFAKVSEVMTALDWTWWDTDGVPEIWDLRKMARERLKSAVKGLISSGEKRYYSACGGFFAEAEIEEGNPKIYMKLSFVVSDWDNYESD